MTADLATLLREHRLLAIVRGTDPEAALRTVLVLAEAGIGLIEVSLTSAGALRVLAAARRELGPDAPLGAGTVLTADDAARAAGAGASYLVTPAICEDLRAAAGHLPVLMGAFTPSEVAAAMRRGACAVKLFPASLGGPGYVRALRDPFPGVPLVPVGGVALAQAPAYFAAGAAAVGAGSPLIGDAASGGDPAGLRSRITAWQDMLARMAA
ncbi:MAG: bifunctional 4-hydroxy-2-oxoglutarate aldolase/2-dehydro-3-deoxy-phosphogluconate aldolase [Streptosporangiaceae bacterium]|nr:bifunctional 4-hydroxy-2-oxoglutarate aldolase/2-dehydro-3-deoxy-phosphogluconate aldolase [Streptosporangiaceae bacterium]MBV9854424.1 bifunctional 4-hydroxy-2-oxoglutarate aldolase/2-dehydro-3-deoxy-phosphogluconate aldolase [Streptosporangiaceae bacterium]